MENIAVILSKTRFPENIGMAARACANMGCGELILVKPERWDFLKAEPLATSKGLPLLENIAIFPDLEAALAPFHYAAATTARLGAWRRGIKPPEVVAKNLAARTASGQKCALVFGPEDRGLTNEELGKCQALIHVPTAQDASSLNLAQTVLLCLYEYRRVRFGRDAGVRRRNVIKLAEFGLLERNLKETLQTLGCLDRASPDYFFRVWRDLLSRIQIERHEFDALMGFCRRIKNRLGNG